MLNIRVQVSKCTDDVLVLNFLENYTTQGTTSTGNNVSSFLQPFTGEFFIRFMFREDA
jgi:hypothetical protein